MVLQQEAVHFQLSPRPPVQIDSKTKTNVTAPVEIQGTIFIHFW